MYHLSKKFRFETAHRLGKGYEGKCQNIHGHSWNGELVVSCEELDQYDFGVDFNILKTFTKQIEEELDHGLMLNKSDQELITLCREKGWMVIEFDGNPTCEVVSKWIFEKAKQFFAEYNFTIHKVVIEETCTSRCEYFGR